MHRLFHPLLLPSRLIRPVLLPIGTMVFVFSAFAMAGLFDEGFREGIRNYRMYGVMGLGLGFTLIVGVIHELERALAKLRIELRETHLELTELKARQK